MVLEQLVVGVGAEEPVGPRLERLPLCGQVPEGLQAEAERRHGRAVHRGRQRDGARSQLVRRPRP